MLIDVDQYARIAGVKLCYIDVLKLPHKTRTPQDDAAFNSSWPCAFLLHDGARLWPLTAIPDDRFMNRRVTLLIIAPNVQAETRDQAIRAARAFST